MTIFVTSDGNKYEATTDAELVSKMRASSFTSSNSDAEFMATVAARLIEDGIAIPTTDAEAFVTALVDAGLVNEKEDEGGSTD